MSKELEKSINFIDEMLYKASVLDLDYITVDEQFVDELTNIKQALLKAQEQEKD